MPLSPLFRQGVLLALVLAPLLAACQPAANVTPGAPGQPSGQRAVSQQRLVWATSALVPTLHPFITIASTQRRYDIYDMVVGQKADGNVQPMVATAWRLVSDTQWEFTIRADLHFHDGSKVTAEDVKFSIDIAKDPERKYAILSRVTTLAETSLKPGAPDVVIVTTRVPDPILLKRLALVSVLPKAVVERMGDDQFGQKPIGSGPYKVALFKPEDTLELVANPDHPFRKPTIEQVVVRNIREASAREAGLRSGEVDFVDYLSVDQGEKLKAAGFGLNVITSGQSQGYWMDTVIGDRPTPYPTADKRVRQAINYAIDKELINKNIYRGFSSVEQCQPVQPQTFGFNPNLKPYPYDPAKAKRLLAEAGYPNGGIKLKLEFFKSAPEPEQVALLVQQQLRDVGIDLEVNPLSDYATFRDKFYGVQERPPLFLPGLLNSPAMDADFALVWFSSTQPGGYTPLHQPGVRPLLPGLDDRDERRAAQGTAQSGAGCPLRRGTLCLPGDERAHPGLQARTCRGLSRGPTMSLSCRSCAGAEPPAGR
ncbi:MAG: hypothetical protein KatS3mg061_3418 [Dehalococcoidia bacterium]|nr:MAG: hypothetical protein KatS3mg061_3418 [Dehalococcoidia bacterium]